MRTRLFILAAALAFAACGDEQPTAPVTSKETLAADQAPSGQIIAIGKARLTVTIVNSAVVHYGLLGPQSGRTVATCPVGSQVVGGGYVLHGDGWLDMQVKLSFPEDNGWSVAVYNGANTDGTLQVYATCIQ